MKGYKAAAVLLERRRRVFGENGRFVRYEFGFDGRAGKCQ
jgi:hypothetical protein